jgi:hypothetical protein
MNEPTFIRSGESFLYIILEDLAISLRLETVSNTFRQRAWRVTSTYCTRIVTAITKVIKAAYYAYWKM